jgi:signal transduction histidine kinase
MALPAGLTYLSLKRTDNAEAAVHARDDFLRLAAHELKTPMTSLRGYTQLLLRRIDRGQAFDGADIQQRAERALRIVDAQAAKLSGLVDQLLDLSRLEVGKLTLDCRPIDLAGLARDVAVALRPITPDYRLVVCAPSPVWAMADPLRLEQVVTNLLTNAARYAAGGDRIEVHVDITPDQRPRLAVRDYGVGISPEQRDRIFDRYYQAPRPGEGGATGGTGGMGIGLFVCRQITERLGGTIQVEAPPDGGARFVIVLPHYQPDVTPLAPPSQPAGWPPERATAGTAKAGATAQREGQVVATALSTAWATSFLHTSLWPVMNGSAFRLYSRRGPNS